MRGKRAPKRPVKPDGIYGSYLVSKLINSIMKDGKKTVASKIVYTALDTVKEKTKMNQLEALEAAMKNLKPPLEVRSKRIGGANFQVPVQVNEDRQLTLALRWLITTARDSRGKRDFHQALATEIINSINKEGNAYKKKEEVLRMAEANRAFAQFA